MVRRREIPKREHLPDPVYHSTTLAQFIAAVMKDGKKSTSEAAVYGALNIIKGRLGGEDPIIVFDKAIENAKPMSAADDTVTKLIELGLVKAADSK